MCGPVNAPGTPAWCGSLCSPQRTSQQARFHQPTTLAAAALRAQTQRRSPVARKNFLPLALEQTPRFATLQRVTIASPDCMPEVRDKLEREGFVFAPASLMRACL